MTLVPFEYAIVFISSLTPYFQGLQMTLGFRLKYLECLLLVRDCEESASLSLLEVEFCVLP